MRKNTKENSNKHLIIIDNVKNGDTFNYSLLICKGHLENLSETKCKPQPHLLIKTNNNEKTININPNTNNFKFLIDLKLGTNNINIYFCCTSLGITLEYKLRNTNLSVLPLYIICKGHEGRFQAPKTESNTPESACNRIITGCKLLQSLYAEKLYGAGFGRKTFQLKSTCVTFHSELNVEEVFKMGQLELWYYFAREIMGSSIGDCDTKYLGFLSCTNYNGSNYSEDMKEYSDIIGLTQGYVAFGGEGFALLGTGCLYTWPENVLEIERRFNDKSIVDRRKFMDDSCYRGTLGGCFATTLGATLHELSHTFDLGHTENGIMGRGFDEIQNVFCETDLDLVKTKRSDEIFWTENCLIFLNFHRWFNAFKIKRKPILQYNEEGRIIKSTAGIRVVEIRRKLDEMVLHYWVFKTKVLKYSFQVKELQNLEEVVLVIEDNEGNILKGKY